MKARLSHSEKQLAGVLIAIPVLFVLFFIWSKVGKPQLLSTPKPVIKAQFAGANRIFVITQDALTRNAALLATYALYDLTSGEELWSRDIDARTGRYELNISPDGQWLLTNSTYTQNGVTLSDAKTGDVVQTLAQGSARWLDATHFILFRKNERQFWAIENGRPQLQHQTHKNFFIPSPDQTLGIETWHQGGDVARIPTIRPRNIGIEYDAIVSLKDGKRIHQLPGDGWHSFSWQKKGTQLWGVVVLNASPQRADILRYDLATRKTTATRLEISDKVRDYYFGALDFNFSPDDRWLAAGTSPSVRVVWNAATGRLVKVLIETQNHPGYYTDAEPQFSTDSQILLRPTREGVEFYHLGEP